MQVVFNHVACDICGKDNPKRIGRPYVSNLLKEIVSGYENVSIVRCRHCGFYYTDFMPFWSKESLRHLYNDKYVPSHDDWWVHQRMHVDPRRRLNLIEETCTLKIERFLDIGCGEGFTLEEALRRGWQAQGLEASPFFAARARSKLGIDVFEGQIYEAHYPSTYFDAVYMDSVLEHLQSPRVMIREIHRILKPGGCVYLGVPNEDALIKDYLTLAEQIKRPGSTWTPRLSPLENPYHIVGFTKHTLRKLCERNGLEMKYISVLRGVEPWRKTHRDGTLRPGLRHGMMKQIHQAIWTVGGFLGRGFVIEAIAVRNVIP